MQDNLTRLLRQEDTDGDKKITALDQGARQFEVRDAQRRPLLVAGAYELGNLLQALGIAAQEGFREASLDPGVLHRSPPAHLSCMISKHYWKKLTRTLDAGGLARIADDPKVKSDGVLRVYVPFADNAAFGYYAALRQSRPALRLDVQRLPQVITPAYVKRLNDAPGVVALAYNKEPGGAIRPQPFVVPGGRFNELYGWDSYFIVRGLLADGQIELSRAMVEHFVYEIEHYGRILNANRTYYLTRSQPPFLTAMIRAVYERLPKCAEDRQWLQRALGAAIREYETVWTAGQRLTSTGLSRYYDKGQGIPPETEPGHYDSILRPYAGSQGMSLEAFRRQYQAGERRAPALDEFFVHDRAMRESGHDTTYRLLNRAASLNPVALNSLLYQYETDIADLVESEFRGCLLLPGDRRTESRPWRERAARRREVVNRLLWNEARGLYFDYDFEQRRQIDYVSATTLYPLWSGLASEEQAAKLVAAALPLLEAPGGLLSSTRESRGPVGPDRPLRQWDYPYGWAPHQMIAWDGLLRYGYGSDARRLAYRWLYVVSLVASRHNGAVLEKYDVAARALPPPVEYGTVGMDFEYVPNGGFAWTNASIQVGLRLLRGRQLRALHRMIAPEWIFAQTSVVAPQASCAAPAALVRESP